MIRIRTRPARWVALGLLLWPTQGGVQAAETLDEATVERIQVVPQPTTPDSAEVLGGLWVRVATRATIA